MADESEIQIHLAEYKILRDEVDQYSQRIDKMSGIYLTALFGLVGYLLQPASILQVASQNPIGDYLKKIESSDILTSLLIFLPILNSVLLIRIMSFYTGLLAIAQYVHYVIRPRLAVLVGHDVIRWDETSRLTAKKIWIPLRSLGQGLFIVISEAISIAVLVHTIYVFKMSWPVIALYAISWLFLIASGGALVAAWKAGLTFHDPGKAQEFLTPSIAAQKPTNDYS